MSFPFMHLAGQKVATSRYVKRRSRDFGETMDVFLDAPRQIIKIHGRANVLEAVREINLATVPDERPGMWYHFGGEED